MKKPTIKMFSALTLFLSASGLVAQEPTAEDYTLSMAGALINNHCEQIPQSSAYVSTHACNYDLAQRYHLELATADFEECRVEAGGDIVKIADCMLERFTEWAADPADSGAK